MNDMYALFPFGLQLSQDVLNVCARAFYHKRTDYLWLAYTSWLLKLKRTIHDDMIQISLIPHSRRYKGLYQIRTPKQRYLRGHFLACAVIDAAHDLVYLVPEVVKHFRCGLIF